MTGAEQRDRKRLEQRARILEAARRLFAERGPDDVTVAEVAHDAGVARATVFNHFGSKHALIEGITEEVLEGYVDLIDHALALSETPVPALIAALFETMGHGIEDDRRFYRGVFREIAKLSLGLDEGGPGQRARQAALERLVVLLLRGQERGELTRRHRAEDLATAFDGLVFGTITHWLYDDPSESLEDRMRRAGDVFLAPVALDAEAPTAGPTPILWDEQQDRRRAARGLEEEA